MQPRARGPSEPGSSASARNSPHAGSTAPVRGRPAMRAAAAHEALANPIPAAARWPPVLRPPARTRAELRTDEMAALQLVNGVVRDAVGASRRGVDRPARSPRRDEGALDL